jgi:exosome complex RNA-binding protein Rrp42 (RNase PH superfamily)
VLSTERRLLIFFYSFKPYVECFFNKKTRPDGRLFSQARPTTIQKGILTKNSAGSAIVTFGAHGKACNTTIVLAAVSLQVGQPTTSPDCPAGKGDVVVTVGDNGNASVNISILQSFLQRVMDACVDSAVDGNTSQHAGQRKEQQQHPLVLIPGKAAMRLCVTVQLLQGAGNVGDACILACVAALQDARIPTDDSVHLSESGTVYWKHDGQTKQLQLPILPIPLTMGLWLATDSGAEEHSEEKTPRIWIVDPDHDEAECMSTTLTVIVNGAANHSVLLLDLSGNTTVRTAELALAIQMTAGRAEEVVEILQSSPNRHPSEVDAMKE